MNSAETCNRQSGPELIFTCIHFNYFWQTIAPNINFGNLNRGFETTIISLAFWFMPFSRLYAVTPNGQFIDSAQFSKLSYRKSTLEKVSNEWVTLVNWCVVLELRHCYGAKSRRRRHWLLPALNGISPCSKANDRWMNRTESPFFWRQQRVRSPWTTVNQTAQRCLGGRSAAVPLCTFLPVVVIWVRCPSSRCDAKPRACGLAPPPWQRNCTGCTIFSQKLYGLIKLWH